MSQMATLRKIKPHKLVTRLQKASVYSHISRTSGVRLHINAPDLWIETIELQRSLFAEILNLIDNFIPAIISSSWIAFAIFVGQTRAQTFDHI